MADSPHEIVCPCCGAEISVDASTGAILSHRAPKKAAHLSFEEAASEARSALSRAEDKFSKAVQEQSRQSEILDKKFRKALEKAADDETPLPNPFDLD